MSEATYLGQKEPVSVDQAVESSRLLYSEQPRAKLYAALIKAQGELDGAKKAAKNDHFRSKYARLEDVIDAVRPTFAKYGLGYVQQCAHRQDGTTGYAVVTTVLVHESGEEIESTLQLPVTKNDAQGVGSALTYARRYGLLGMAGIAPEDDDGEAAVGRTGVREDPDRVSFMGATLAAFDAMSKGDIEGMKIRYTELKTFNGKVPGEELMAVLKPLGDKITHLKAQIILKGDK